MKWFAVITLCSWGCSSAPVTANAFRIQRPDDLIGGPSALGQVGDYMLRNGKLRVIVQDVGFSRGFAVYGGSLIDADLRHPLEPANAQGGQGNDRFGELFPVFFLQASNPTQITIPNDGSDGKPAHIVVQGMPGPFITMLDTLNDVTLGAGDLAFQVDYSLGPNDRYVTITQTITNTTDFPRSFPALSLGSVQIPVPFGNIALMGTTNKVFVPGQAGFDLRFTLPEVNQATPRTLPALPGIVSDFIATKNDGVSYGLFAEVNPQHDFAYLNRDQYGAQANPGSLEIPFFFSSFLGYYYSLAPTTLGAGESFSFTQYFAVGRGDVADIRDIYHAQRGIATGSFSGRVREDQTYLPMASTSVVVFDAQGNPFNQHTTDANGNFIGTLPAGDYTYQVVADDHPLAAPQPFHIDLGQTTERDIFVPNTALLSVQITDDSGRGLPAHVVVVGTHPPTTQTDPRKFLFNLARGDRRRQLDLANLAGNRYVEAQFDTANGMVGQKVRPGAYTVYVSRGVEYEVFQRDVQLTAGQSTQLAVTLHQSFDSEGYVSGDLHLHSSNSVDSGLLPQDRVIGCAADGLEFVVATDHNYITDYSPIVGSLNLTQFLFPIVGIELTTLELGHYNGYPLNYDLSTANHGSFPWFDRPAGDIFNQLRSLGKYGPDNTIVQVNHPRDSLNGYFSDMELSGDNIDILPRGGIIASQGPQFDPSAFSLDFDALEIMNGKRLDLLRTLRVPNPPPAAGTYPTQTSSGTPINAPGDIMRTPDGLVAYPGAVDDWFHFLSSGYRFTGVGNSDSHTNQLEEPGFPRTYIRIGKDRAVDIRELDVVGALKAHAATLSMGPFLELFVNDQPIGSELKNVSALAARMRVRKAAFVHIDTLNLYVNGALWKSYPLHDLPDETINDSLTVSADSYLVAEVSGATQSLFPVVTGLEEPPLTLASAIGDLGASFGLNENPLGSLTPNLVHAVYPYAITNPIWVDIAGDGFNAPGIAPVPAVARNAVAPAKVYFPANDVRAIFRSFSGHSHD
jgi:hypothetical protein